MSVGGCVMYMDHGAKAGFSGHNEIYKVHGVHGVSEVHGS